MGLGSEAEIGSEPVALVLLAILKTHGKYSLLQLLSLESGDSGAVVITPAAPAFLASPLRRLRLVRAA